MKVFFFGLLIYTRFCDVHSYFAIPGFKSICFPKFCAILGKIGWRAYGSFSFGECRPQASISRHEGPPCCTVFDLHLSQSSRVFLTPISNPSLQIGKIIETSLSANQERAAMEKKRLKWKVQGPTTDEKMIRGRPVDPSKLVVELGPMEIRTFIVSFDHSISGNQLL